GNEKNPPRGSFPGNLHLVLVLRPTALFQRTLSDFLFKYNKDEFKMKVPVVMLSTVTELHAYIDPGQLTTELGGTQEYCHDSWISHRTAIEAFALMVKTVAQTLQAFGTELAETELPNDADATVHLLHEHTLKKDTMKVNNLNLFRHPVLFLFYSLCFRLLGQLDETETAFDDFWERHRTKLEQCLQLRHFEKHFREVSQVQSQETLSYLCLESEGDRLIENSHYAEDCIRPKCSELRGVCEEIGSTLRSKKGLLLRALELHHALEKASQWCEEGIFLLANQPVDRCQSQDGAEAALQELERYLDTAALHTLTDRSAICYKVFQKQSSVQEMFEKRQVSLKKLAAKQTRPVQPVAPRPEVKSPLSSPSKHLLKPWLQPNSSQANLGQSQSFCVCALSVVPRHVMNELLETERVYVEELLCVLEGYAAEMDNPAMAHLIPSSLQSKKDILFGNMPEIYQFHKRTFLTELEAYTDRPELVGRCFLERMSDLQIYEAYCQNKPRSESLWRQCSDCAFFQECQKKLEHKLGLDSYLLKPVQRITKYQLLLKELLKYSKGCDGAADLQEALSSILGILKAVNDSMHLIAITGYEGNLSELGRLLMQGSFSVWTEHKKGHAKVKDLARFKPMQRHLFLHEKALLFCKRREENGEGYEKAPSYSFKHSLRMSAVGITENAKGDNKKFEIWCNSREEVFIVQVSSGLLKTPPVSLQNTQRGNNALLFLGPNRGDQNGMGERDPQSSDSAAQTLCNLDSISLRHLHLHGSPCSIFLPLPASHPKPSPPDEAVTSPTTDRSSVAKKRFTLQGFSNLKSPKGNIRDVTDRMSFLIKADGGALSASVLEVFCHLVVKA
uniref:Mcf.2 cell line derived transforming sequence-like a n=1 Tax=Fundulus heteroclitus TaxID=8078 RepID=A0A3Q2Q0X3_FUNHE